MHLLAGPTTPTRQRHRAITPHRFRLIPVRSPLLRESRLLSLPRPTEMFQFGRFPPLGLCVQPRVTGHDPCRVSPFGHPRIQALLAAPRGFSQPHASFFGSWRQGIHRKPFLTWPIDARARYEVLKVLGALRPRPEGSHPQHRTACPAGASPQPRVPPSRGWTPDRCWRDAGRIVSVQPRASRSSRSRPPRSRRLRRRGRVPMLLRKEVIQPHLPVRLPCYDFTPIAGPTFGSSLPKGWATDFGCYRLSWCDGRCVQGPGTYSPRRC